MESTGSYWIPVKNILEDSVKIVLVCARRQKPARGDKTDFRDARSLAHLHRHGLLKGSFLPPRAQVELRDLTRRRKKLPGNLSAEKNRIQRVLETANVNIGNIVSDVFGVSGQAMVSVLIAGQRIDVTEIADLSKQRLRKRIPIITDGSSGNRWNTRYCSTGNWKSWNRGSKSASNPGKSCTNCCRHSGGEGDDSGDHTGRDRCGHEPV
jgi:hypothetical protein